jgi:hypothetical protein
LENSVWKRLWPCRETDTYLSVGSVISLNMSPVQIYLGRIFFHKLLKSNQNAWGRFRENHIFFCPLSLWRVPIFGARMFIFADLLWINSWIPNMNKIQSTVRTLARRTYTHTYIETAFQKQLFFISVYEKVKIHFSEKEMFCFYCGGIVSLF